MNNHPSLVGVISYLHKKFLLSKKQLYLYGWITLLVFPIPAFLILHFAEGTSLIDFLDVKGYDTGLVLIGLLVGILYALFAFIILSFPIFKKIPLPIDRLIRNLNLTYTDAVFLSLCAGIGEELLFRAGIQHYLGIWFTSFLFVAVHGYFSIKTPLKSLYGLLVLPLSLLLGYGYESFGLWFSIAIHFAYDLTLFVAIIYYPKKNLNDE